MNRKQTIKKSSVAPARHKSRVKRATPDHRERERLYQQAVQLLKVNKYQLYTERVGRSVFVLSLPIFTLHTAIHVIVLAK